MPWQLSHFAVGQSIWLETFVQNTGASPIEFCYLDDGHPRIQRDGDFLTLICGPITGEHSCSIRPGELDRHSVDLAQSITEPGMYHMKVIFDVPNGPVPSGPKYYRRMESNIISVPIIAAANR